MNLGWYQWNIYQGFFFLLSHHRVKGEDQSCPTYSSVKKDVYYLLQVAVLLGSNLRTRVLRMAAPVSNTAKPHAALLFWHCYFIVNSQGHKILFVPLVVSPFVFLLRWLCLGSALSHFLQQTTTNIYWTARSVLLPSKTASAPVRSIVPLHSPCKGL